MTMDKEKPKTTPPLSTINSHTPLTVDIRTLIDTAKQRAAVAVNVEISQLYWQVGNRIQQEVLQGERAEYGKQVIAGLAKQLKQAYGKGWSEQQLQHCLYAVNTFSDEKIFYTLCRELSWSHLIKVKMMEQL